MKMIKADAVKTAINVSFFTETLIGSTHHSVQILPAAALETDHESVWQTYDRCYAAADPALTYADTVTAVGFTYADASALNLYHIQTGIVGDYYFIRLSDRS